MLSIDFHIRLVDIRVLQDGFSTGKGVVRRECLLYYILRLSEEFRRIRGGPARARSHRRISAHRKRGQKSLFFMQNRRFTLSWQQDIAGIQIDVFNLYRTPSAFIYGGKLLGKHHTPRQQDVPIGAQIHWTDTRGYDHLSISIKLKLTVRIQRWTHTGRGSGC